MAAKPLDVNTASMQELEALDDIGPKRAALIVQMRDAVGAITENIFMMLDIPHHVKERIVSKGELVFVLQESQLESKSVDLNQFCKSMVGAFDSVKVEIRQLSGTMSSEIQSIKQDVSDIHGRIDKVADDFDDLKQEVNHLKVKVERKSSGSSGHSSGSDKEKRCSRKLKLEGFGSDKPLSIEIHQDEQKQAAIDHLEDSDEQVRRLKQERLDFEREYLSKSERYRSELAQSELSSRNLNAEYKKYQG